MDHVLIKRFPIELRVIASYVDYVRFTQLIYNLVKDERSCLNHAVLYYNMHPSYDLFVNDAFYEFNIYPLEDRFNMFDLYIIYKSTRILYPDLEFLVVQPVHLAENIHFLESIYG